MPLSTGWVLDEIDIQEGSGKVNRELAKITGITPPALTLGAGGWIVPELFVRLRVWRTAPECDARRVPPSPDQFPRCASLRTQALPPASNRISALRPPSANAPCQRRIVSSSSKRTRATCSQLRPSSSNTSALARRANRSVTDPSRASAISAERSSPNKKPGQISPQRSNSTRLARAFRIPNKLGYINGGRAASQSAQNPSFEELIENLVDAGWIHGAPDFLEGPNQRRQER